MEAFSFNTAIARMMEFLNALTKYSALKEKNIPLLRAAAKDLLLLLAPCAPHFAEELFEQIGGKGSIFDQDYPVEDETKLVLDETEYAVQVNSKIVLRAKFKNGLTNEEIEKTALALNEVKERVEGKQVKKCIVVQGRLVNLIVG